MKYSDGNQGILDNQDVPEGIQREIVQRRFPQVTASRNLRLYARCTGSDYTPRHPFLSGSEHRDVCTGDIQFRYFPIFGGLPCSMVLLDAREISVSGSNNPFKNISMLNLALLFHIPVFFLLAERKRDRHGHKKETIALLSFFCSAFMSRMPGINSGAKSCDNYIQRFIRNYIL